MVNVPKTRKCFCPGKVGFQRRASRPVRAVPCRLCSSPCFSSRLQECRKHTLHKVTQYKAGKASLFAQGLSGPGLGQCQGEGLGKKRRGGVGASLLPHTHAPPNRSRL